MKYNALDEALQLLNGLHDDADKRNEIIRYIEENGQIAVFSYGSLLWNPIDHVDRIVLDCNVHRYKKGFICEDFIYRGTMNFTGLTMGLQEDIDGHVHGGLLIADSDQSVPFIKALAKRETPMNTNGTVMDIYIYEFLEVVMSDGFNRQYALTCVANTESLCYINEPITVKEQAWKMARAYGQNGTNLQYLRNSINMYRKFNLQDSSTCEMENLYEKVLFYRQKLPVGHQKWLEEYDELETLEERQRVAQSQESVRFQTDFQPYLHLQEISVV